MAITIDGESIFLKEEVCELTCFPGYRIGFKNINPAYNRRILKKYKIKRVVIIFYFKKSEKTKRSAFRKGMFLQKR